MRYAIFSDIHSNLQALDAVLEAYQKENVDAYLCVGDVVGYGASPRECIERVNSLTQTVVAGNHDFAAVDLFPLDFFNEYARAALVWTKGVLGEEEKKFLQTLKLTYSDDELTLVHGTLDNPEEFNYLTDIYTASRIFELLKTHVCFLGHTHVPGVVVRDIKRNVFYNEQNRVTFDPIMRYIVNVGSVGQPRDNDPRASFCVYDTGNKTVELKKVIYDVEKARKKIIESGLPVELGDRLRLGV